jgi:cytochrome c biogenesis protein CcmG, thiol:disulfide interchange protein DsbE
MFWVTSCYDCQDQLVMLRQFAKAHPNVAVVAIDRGEDAGTIRRYLATKHLGGLPVWIDESAQASANYTVTSLPATFFIDKHGILRGYNFGPVSDLNSLEIQADYAERGVNHTAT